ncbi:MAG: trehalose-6-phosphate synthase [Gemmatimonadetes bacterium]|nr:trehalose-6-phosphate synthase [Gemmatimonadota bacterium]
MKGGEKEELRAGRLLIASNRLPISLRQDEDGTWLREPGSGGLVTALEPVLRKSGGVWVGWPGVLDGQIPDLDEVLSRESGDAPYAVEPVSLTADERRDFYQGFANEILWPLCHGLQSRCNYQSRYWDAYRRVNRRFSDAIARVAQPGDFIWVHDYHLMAVGEELRRRGLRQRVGFFLHIPFPPLDVFEQLPWAEEVLDSLLRFDGVGFQTRRDLRNFIHCVEALADEDVVVDGDAETVRVPGDGRTVQVGAYPISIDLEAFEGGAGEARVTRQVQALRRELKAERVILGVDRLDYTKGIPQKLLGLERALEKYPHLRGRVTLFQLVVPSRERIPEYNRMKKEIEGLVGRINGRFTRGGWAPILYRFGTWEQHELLAYYRLAHVALVTPLRDGMNLVSKEYVAASVDGDGVLVLSSFAGSADELRDGALLVNPNDVEAVADAIHVACSMEAGERGRRMAMLRDQVRDHDVFRWVDGFLEANAPPSGGGPPPGEEGAPLQRRSAWPPRRPRVARPEPDHLPLPGARPRD